MNVSKVVLIVLTWLITISDSYFATRAGWLELNPIANSSLGFPVLIGIKLIFAGVMTYFILRNKHRNEAHLFYFSTTLMLIIFLWGYGAFSGIWGYGSYQEAEQEYITQEVIRIEQETGIPPSPQEVEVMREETRAEVQENVREIALPAYVKVVWIFGVFPYAFSCFSFYIFRKLLPTAKLRTRILK